MPKLDTDTLPHEVVSAEVVGHGDAKLLTDHAHLPPALATVIDVRRVPHETHPVRSILRAVVDREVLDRDDDDADELVIP
jgi:hypothetical protein